MLHVAMHFASSWRDALQSTRAVAKHSQTYQQDFPVEHSILLLAELQSLLA